MSVNKVIICGKIIKPEENKELFNSIGSNDVNILPNLPNSDNNFIFYVNTKGHENSSGGVIACRFSHRDLYTNFKNAYDYNSRIYIVGHLMSNESKEYYNFIHVDFCKKPSKATHNYNLAIISGKTLKISHKDFMIINVGDTCIDIYNEDNEHKNILNIGYKVSIIGNIKLSNDINKSIDTGYADNAIFINRDNIYTNYSISKYKKSEYAPSEQFNGTLQKFNKLTFNNNSESDIFNNFKCIENIAGLKYNNFDLVNFHIAMKNRGLVILAGPSGTGKTELVRCYAEALGLLRPNDSSHYLHISVNPSWADDTDLLGYYDPRGNNNKGLYHPSNSGLVNLLINAFYNPHKLYIVLFDEMNLARVEYYFSQFLSILELPLNDKNRCIKLFAGDNKDKNDIPSRIHIRNNILFVGTINIDESTKNITDKVLDRSNLVNISSNKFTPDLFKHKNTGKLEQLLNSINPITLDEFNSFKNEMPDNNLSKDNNNDKLAVLSDLNKLFKHATYNHLEIGYRVVKQINEYLCDIPNDKTILGEDPKKFAEDSFDMQLCQRIFDKLSGDKYHLYDLIKFLYGSLDQSYEHEHKNLFNRSSKLYGNYKKLANDFQKISHKHSKEIIYRKLMELNNYGFTE